VCCAIGGWEVGLSSTTNSEKSYFKEIGRGIESLSCCKVCHSCAINFVCIAAGKKAKSQVRSEWRQILSTTNLKTLNAKASHMYLSFTHRRASQDFLMSIFENFDLKITYLSFSSSRSRRGLSLSI
jgi:hypothetical protein